MAATAPKIVGSHDDVDLFLTPPQARRVEPAEDASETMIRAVCFMVVVGFFVMLATLIGVGVLAVQAALKPAVQAEAEENK